VTALHYLIRRLLRAPGFTAATVLTLAIGIGATTAIFSVVNGVLLRPLPFPESDRLIALTHQTPGEDDAVHHASPAIYFTYRDNNRTFESVALWSTGPATVTGGGDPEEIQAVSATREFLPTLRVQPAIGRGFSEADDQPGSARTVILSYGYWQRRFGGAPDAVGRTMTIGGIPHEVIGVLPRTFRFLEQQADILMPAQLARATAFAGPIGEHGIARLEDGATIEDASADVARMIPILFDTFPLVPGLTRERVEHWQFGPQLRPLKAQVVGDLDDVLWVLMGTIGTLLLIACANVANLQLVRTEARGQELAIRAALGAGWRRIARSLLLESTVLGLVGGAVGVAFAVLALPALVALAGPQLPGALDVTIDSSVLGFALVVSLASGVLFGLVPSLKYASPRVATALHGSARAYGASRERHRVRNALVVAQIALALVLLVASGLMMRSFQSLHDVDPGLSAPENIQTLRISIPQALAMRDFPSVIRMQNDIEERLEEVTGVESVGFSTRLPLLRSGPSGSFAFEDTPDAQALEIEFRYTSPGFFATLGTPLLAGRGLEWSDTYEGHQVVMISANLATKQWGSPAAAIGKKVRRSAATPWLEIIGVVGDIRHDGLERPAPVTIYLLESEFIARFAATTVFFFLRSDRVGTAGFVDELARTIWSVNADLPLGSVQTLGDVYARSMARTSLTLVLLSITAAMALLLGLVGVYGMIDHMLAQRTREIGIRMALGAQVSAVKHMLLRQTLLLVGVGVAVGLVSAAAATRLMGSLLFGVTALDPTTYAAVAGVLVATAIAAGYLPARRVTRVDPMQALRAE